MRPEVIEASSPLLRNVTDILRDERPKDWQNLTKQMIRGIYVFVDQGNSDFWDYLDEHPEINDLLSKERGDRLGKDSSGDPKTILSATRQIIENYRIRG